jgi:hypothetical protein
VQNRSLEPLELSAQRDLRLVDRDGDRVPGSAIFLEGFAHGLYPSTRPPPGGVPEAELRRIGRKARIEPGKSAPLTVSWRQRPGSDPPVRINYGRGSLPVP